MKQLLYVLVFFITAASLPLTLIAQGLDASFGNGGVVITNFGFGNTYESANSIVQQPDGKIIAAGGGDFAKLARYNINGSLDPNFGSGGSDGDGKVTIQTVPGSSQEYINDILLLQSGEILVAGSGSNLGQLFMFILKLNSDGSRSADFTNGIMLNLSGFHSPHIELQSDGKIILTLFKSANATRELRRLNSNGTPDLNFGGAQDGIVSLNLTYSNMLVGPGNEIFICGAYGGNFALLKYSAEGYLLGNVVTAFDNSSQAQAITLQQDGKIILAGEVNNNDGFNDLAIAKYSSDGVLDNSFNNDGKVTIDLGNDYSVSGVAIQAGNKIVVAGYDYDDDDDRYSFLRSVRYLENGVLDPCYGQAGIFSHSFGGIYTSRTADLKLQSDGKILFAGEHASDFVLLRYTDKAWYLDADDDGYYAGNLLIQCESPGTGYYDASSDPPLGGNDCDDNDADINPGETEICDGKDNNCDGLVDEGLTTVTYYTDADGDNYGTGTGQGFCSNPGSGYATQAGDCNDSDPNIHPSLPGTAELCDGIDNDCDGIIDEGCSGMPNVSIGDVSVYESEGKAVLNIHLSFITTLQVKINYSTSDGTAVSNKKEKDYKAFGNSMLTIPPGTLNTSITIPIYNDGKKEANEYFYVNLTRPTNCILSDPTAIVTILEGTAPVATINNSGRISEGVVKDQAEPMSTFDVKAYPNPSSSAFTLQINSTAVTPAEVRIINSIGQVVRTLRATNNTLHFGEELKPGIYIVEVRQGETRKTIKLVKQ